MTIYVDDSRIQATVGRISARWSHLTTDQDDPAELHEFAHVIGLQRAWFQPGKSLIPGRTPPPWYAHYDVTEGKRQEAIRAGATAITWREAGLQMRERANAAKAASAVSSGVDSTTSQEEKP